jgi:hypothetical protein
MADTSKMQLAYRTEGTAFGVALTTGTFQVLRITGEGLKEDVAAQDSNEIRSDRQTSDVRRTRITASGSVNGELSYGTYDDLLAAALMDSAWSSPATVGPGTSFSAVVSGNAITDSANGLGSLVVGSWIKVSGFAGAANNGKFKILTVAAGAITVSGTTLTAESAGPSVTIVQGAEIVNGSTAWSCNLERKYTDLTSAYALFLGMEVDGFSLTIPSEGRVTVSFDFLGTQETSKTTASGSAYTAATTTATLTALEANLLEGQVSCANTLVDFSMAVKNNLRAKMYHNGTTPLAVGVGQCQISGSLKVYFETATLFGKFLSESASSLAITLADSAGNAYVIDLPSVKLTAGQRPAGGNNQDIIADFGWSAYMHATESVMVRIVRWTA